MTTATSKDQTQRLYAERDIEDQGGHYARHVNAMTAEGLHAKSDIAAELAHRDIDVEVWKGNYQTLMEAYSALLAQQSRLRSALRGVMECTGTSTRQYHIARDALGDSENETGVKATEQPVLLRLLHPPQCRFGCGPAAIIVEFNGDDGCVCYPDKLQALCPQHWQTCEPKSDCYVVADFTQNWGGNAT